MGRQINLVIVIRHLRLPAARGAIYLQIKAVLAIAGVGHLQLVGCSFANLGRAVARDAFSSYQRDTHHPAHLYLQLELPVLVRVTLGLVMAVQLDGMAAIKRTCTRLDAYPDS